MRLLRTLGEAVAAVCVVAARVGAQAPPAQGPPPPGYTTTRTGGPHDFDYFAGGWTTAQRRLKTRAPGSSDWEEFPANLCMTPYLGGMVTVDELVFPTKGWAGVTVRTFDLQRRQWSIYWISSQAGRLEAPVVGGFTGNAGEFYGEDHDGDRHVYVRFRWTKIDQNRAHWEQAFSYDGRTWQTNWTAEFHRADTARVCEGGRPTP